MSLFSAPKGGNKAVTAAAEQVVKIVKAPK